MNRTGFKKMLTVLEAYQSQIEEAVEKKEEALDNANDAEYPNEERIGKLEEESNALDEIRDLLEQLTEAVNDYVEM